MSAEAWTNLLVALGTGLLAAFTFVMARAANRQIADRQKEVEQARRPAIFMKDLWVRTRPDGSGRVTIQLVSKGIANLGNYALAIHLVEILDATGVALARGHPMTVIPAGQSIGSGEQPLFEPIRATPEVGLTADELRERAAILRLWFRSGAKPTTSYRMDLPKRDMPRRWLNFRGENQAPFEVITND